MTNTDKHGCIAGWRETKKLQTRTSLAGAARALVTEYGLDHVTIDEICQQAGVSRRTFFNYFDTKEEAVLDLPAASLDPTAAAVFRESGPTGELAADVRAFVRSLLEIASPRFDEFRTLAPTIQREPRLISRKIQWFEEQRAAITGLVADRLGPTATASEIELGALGIVALLRGAFLAWESHGLTGTPQAHLDSTAEALGAMFVCGTPAAAPMAEARSS